MKTYRIVFKNKLQNQIDADRFAIDDYGQKTAYLGNDVVGIFPKSASVFIEHLNQSSPIYRNPEDGTNGVNNYGITEDMPDALKEHIRLLGERDMKPMKRPSDYLK